MMSHSGGVTAHVDREVSARGGDPLRKVLTIVRTQSGEPYYKDSDGNFWAMCIFIKDSITYDRADSLELCYKGGVGIGCFQSELADFDKPLAETIKGFHNIRWRFEQWDEALKTDAAGRVKDLAREIAWIETRRGEMMEFWEKGESGERPTRVTHNETKLSNILFG